MSQSLLTGIEIASSASAVATAILVIVVRLFFRREKSLRDP
jgi:hypothetical protein